MARHEDRPTARDAASTRGGDKQAGKQQQHRQETAEQRQDAAMQQERAAPTPEEEAVRREQGGHDRPVGGDHRPHRRPEPDGGKA